MLTEDDWKFAAEDARARLSAILDLIYFHDRLAMNLMRLYITVSIATVSGALASLSKDAPLPAPVGVGLFGATLALVVGIYWAFKVMETTRISLPGRGADFWLWASDSAVDREDVFREYLLNLKTKTDANGNCSALSSERLRLAKLAGALAPVAGVAAGLLALWYKA